MSELGRGGGQYLRWKVVEAWLDAAYSLVNRVEKVFDLEGVQFEAGERFDE
jgi:hypothetical protein